MNKKKWHTVLALAAGITLSSLHMTAGAKETVQVNLFAAASLNQVMEELAQNYSKEHPEVEILINADSSGTLLTQIEEGFACDIFFPAAQKQMDTLEKDGLIVEGTRRDVLKNQVVVIAGKDSETQVTGLADLGKAESVALAGGSVPVGRYTRAAMMKLGLLEEGREPDKITTSEISEALGGVEISEQSNVSKVLLAVAEGSCQVGTTYYSDTFGYENQIEILEYVSTELTGDVVYPVCRVVNEEASPAQEEAAEGFWEYLLSKEAQECYRSFYFEPVQES